jgi:hypothetical protein
MNVDEAIAAAERLLPGEPMGPGEKDPRWQAIIKLEEFIPTNPEQVWAFVKKWGTSANEDVRAAIATCLLEHLLEDQFEWIFDEVQMAVRANPYFADTFAKCWQFGQAERPPNSSRFRALIEEAAIRRTLCKYWTLRQQGKAIPSIPRPAPSSWRRRICISPT